VNHKKYLKQKNKKSGNYATTVQSIIDADKDNRIKKVEIFEPAFEDDTICYFYWVKKRKA
jgi:hypothetical protein